MTKNNERNTYTREELSNIFLGLNTKDQKVVIFLYEWDRPIRVGDIRNYLEYPHSTLNSVIKRLQKQNIVEWEAYGIVRLKQLGRDLAAHQLDHHDVIHKYLVNKLEIPDEKAHEESMRVAGIFSCYTVEKMKEKLPEKKSSNCRLIVDEV